MIYRRSTFSVGDVVRVRGISSPHMTVDFVSNDGPVGCIWFNTNGVLQRARFHPAILARPRHARASA